MRAFIAIALLMSAVATGSAAEIKVISANGMREVIAETKATFEAARSYLSFITGPEALTAVRAHCLTPG